jgi:hypothetical protein
VDKSADNRLLLLLLLLLLLHLLLLLLLLHLLLLLLLSFTKPQEEPALVKASKAGDAERVARLLANGHDPTVRDTKGRSPYQLAANKEVRAAVFGFLSTDYALVVFIAQITHIYIWDTGVL